MRHHPAYPLIKLAIEAGPLLVFFFCNARYGIIYGTGAFMVATLASLAGSYLLERKLPTLPLVTGLFVMVFGGLTLWLQDELFIKLKPTVVNGLFAIILAGGMLMGRPLLRPLLGALLPMTDTGWRVLTWRWAGFFLVLAILNEIIWRNASTDAWVNFKVFGVLPLTILFSFAQAPLIRRHQAPAAAE